MAYILDIVIMSIRYILPYYPLSTTCITAALQGTTLD